MRAQSQKLSETIEDRGTMEDTGGGGSVDLASDAINGLTEPACIPVVRGRKLRGGR